MSTSIRALALGVLALALAGCPQERPEAARQIPREAFPPAMTVEPTAPDGGGARPNAAGAPADAGGTTAADRAPADSDAARQR